MTDALVAFLQARLNEDEATAKAVGYDHVEATDYLWNTKSLSLHRADGTSKVTTAEVDPEFAEHIVRHDPAHVLAEVDAKRQAVAHYEKVRELTTDHEAYVLAESAVLRQLQYMALPYVGHPDYRPEWRP